MRKVSKADLVRLTEALSHIEDAKQAISNTTSVLLGDPFARDVLASLTMAKNDILEKIIEVRD